MTIDGWTASVCTRLDQQQTFLSWTPRERQEDDYDQHGHLLDPIIVKEGKREEIDWVSKQKLFDYVLESPTLLTENMFSRTREKRSVHDWLWEKIKKAKSEDEKTRTE